MTITGLAKVVTVMSRSSIAGASELCSQASGSYTSLAMGSEVLHIIANRKIF